MYTNVDNCGDVNATCPGEDIIVAGEGTCSLPFKELGPEYSIQTKNVHTHHVAIKMHDLYMKVI